MFDEDSRPRQTSLSGLFVVCTVQVHMTHKKKLHQQNRHSPRPAGVEPEDVVVPDDALGARANKVQVQVLHSLYFPLLTHDGCIVFRMLHP